MSGRHGNKGVENDVEKGLRIKAYGEVWQPESDEYANLSLYGGYTGVK